MAPDAQPVKSAPPALSSTSQHPGEGVVSSEHFACQPPAATTLTAEQLEAFVVNGYVAIHPEVPPGTHASIMKAADSVYKAAGYDGTQSSSPIGNNILPDVPQLQTVFESPSVHGALRDLLGDGYVAHPHRRPHQNEPGSRPQTLHKDSHAGFEVHRSHSPWLVMAMYYPQEVTLENAPTSVCPGTQYYAGEDRFDARHLDGDQAGPQLEVWGSREVPLRCEAGTVVLLHNDVWHRGTANRTSVRRWMFCFMFVRAVSPSLCRLPQPVLTSHLRSRDSINAYIRAWLNGGAAPSVIVDVAAELALLASAEDDQPRLSAAYSLAFAVDYKAASLALARVLREATAEPLRRAAKFGAAAACRQQLLLHGAEDMVQALLSIATTPQADPGASACAARALGEHGAWSAAQESLRVRVVEALSAAVHVLMGPRRPSGKDGGATQSSVKPSLSAKVGKQCGRVISWREGRDYGFIRPAPCGNHIHGEDVWVASAAFGGGSLTQGMQVQFDTMRDKRTGKVQAVNVAGPAVCRSGGRQVGCRNACMAIVEALPLVPEGSDPCVAIVAQTLADVLGQLSKRVHEIVGNPSKQSEGEVLVAAAMAAARLITRCGPRVGSTDWWQKCLRNSIRELVYSAAQTRPPAGARKAGAGGTPGADNGVRYALSYGLEAMWRSGDESAFMEVASLFPDLCANLEDGRSTVEALLLRRCHLTTREHPF